jgi:hypothetical protein
MNSQSQKLRHFSQSNMEKEICHKCDERGMVNDGNGAAHSCSCGLHNRLMEKIFESVTLGQLLAYANYRVNEKRNAK